MGLLIPSYSQGFARNAAESANPGLWDGLVGAWSPTLGVTGATLFDQSGFGNHGTLTNMDPATDWVMTEKGWALDTSSGDTECVTLPMTGVVLDRATLSVWVYLTQYLGVSTRYIWVNPHWPDNRVYIQSYDEGGNHNLFVRLGNGASEDTGCNLAEDRWNHVVVTLNKGDSDVFVNGVHVYDYTYTSDPVLFNDFTISATAAGLEDLVGSAQIYTRVLLLPEIQQLCVDSHALFRLRDRTFFVSGGAPPAIAPTSHLYGSLVGPLGGAM